MVSQMKDHLGIMLAAILVQNLTKFNVMKVVLVITEEYQVCLAQVYVILKVTYEKKLFI